MMNARRTAGVGRTEKRVAAIPRGIIADRQIASEQINLFPMIVHERRGCERARVKAQQPRPAAGLAVFVQIACKDLLLDAFGISLRRRPARLHIESEKLDMGFAYRHTIASCSAQNRQGKDVISVPDFSPAYGIL